MHSAMSGQSFFNVKLEYHPVHSSNPFTKLLGFKIYWFVPRWLLRCITRALINPQSRKKKAPNLIL